MVHAVQLTVDGGTVEMWRLLYLGSLFEAVLLRGRNHFLLQLIVRAKFAIALLPTDEMNDT